MLNQIPYGTYGYEAHLNELSEALRWARQQYRDAQGADNEQRIANWAKRVDEAQAAYDRAVRER